MIYNDPVVPPSQPGTSPSSAFKTVQKGVDTAGHKGGGGAGAKTSKGEGVGRTVCLMADGTHYIAKQINIGAYNSGTEGQ